MKVLVILTCFNRKEKTKQCLETLVSVNPTCDFTFVIADDGSNDGTPELIFNMKKSYDIHYIQGDGSLFYSGGMRYAMRYSLDNIIDHYAYMLMVNDDVVFYDHCIEKMIQQSKEQEEAVIVGATCDNSGVMSYSAVRYVKGIKYRKVDLSEWNIPADTFNANCVLIPYSLFEKAGVIDACYIHSLGDFDYGLTLKRMGAKIYVAKEYVGNCNNNSIKGTWMDKSLTRQERIRKKESIKGAPTKQWFYFLKKNFGLFTALKGCITPYIRIVLGK